LPAQADRLVAALAGVATPVRPPQGYTLLTEVRREALPPSPGRRQPPRDDLQERFHPGDTP
jgi:hypothetical protein